MYGLENKKPKRFKFDLEETVKNKKEEKKILDQIHKQKNQLNNILREGQASKYFDQSVTLLQAYVALEQVIQKASKTR